MFHIASRVLLMSRYEIVSMLVLLAVSQLEPNKFALSAQMSVQLLPIYFILQL